MKENSLRPARLIRRVGVAALTIGLACSSLAYADATTYPSKPVRILVPAAAGGGTDAVARLLAEFLASTLKQPVTVDNRPGASGIVATSMVAQAPADGYTLLLAQNGHVLNPALFKKLPYNTSKDFTAIGSLARTPLVLVSSHVTGVKSLSDLKSFVAKNPVNGLGVGVTEATTRIASEMVRVASGIPFETVQYKGAAPALADLAGGHLNFAVATYPSTLPFRDSGKLNYVAVLGQKRATLAASLPTASEQGLTGVDAAGWWGVVGPANMPQAVVTKLANAVSAMLADPQVSKKLADMSAEPWEQSPEKFSTFLEHEQTSAAKLAAQAGIKPE
ncbi:Bug family tripartite tricarboxylate transporter substrate binding protein [Ottowia thiooxydans]|uniref:Tripartite-type tricarboxylate transporter receptor subunit TctC n=1 Tax=Ottowia thiooxydans TaxID=219182 RepID=A0ABV2Q4I4_9BURK